jgi:hypothetical protein
MPKGKDKITPQGKDFFKQIAELGKLKVRIGFTEGGQGFGRNHEGVTADPSITQIAAWNELGTESIPARPFLKQSIDNNKDQIAALGVAQIKELVRGNITAEQALKALGALQVSLVQAEIRNGGFAPNAPSTIAKKSRGTGSTTPLIDTGRLRQSVHYVIEQKGGDD